MFKLLVFDWDGTLMDSATRIVRCFQKAAMDVGVEAPPARRVERLIGLNLKQAWATLMPLAEPPLLERLLVRYRAHFLELDNTETPLFTGVEARLAGLKENGFLLAVATGKSRHGLDQALEATGLGTCFVASRCGNEARSKPHPQMLLNILEQTGVDAAQTVMIGDSEYDMKMARNASVASIAVSYGVQSASRMRKMASHGVFGDFPSLCDFLEMADFHVHASKI